MIIKDIKKYAQTKKISIAGAKSKSDIIKKIQISEGNNDCYKISWAPSCCEKKCLWREDCLNGK